jgi:hypothetical protein
MSGKVPKQPPEPKAFDLLALLAAFARDNGMALDDPVLIEKFTADATRRLGRALADPALLHGSRVERLFEATVLSLGKFQMLKSEDGGRVHAAAKLRVPDFRIGIEDGEQWLVEVKNVRVKQPFKQRTTMSAAYLGSLQDYADLVGVPLKLAIYWSVWNVWTIVSPEHFRQPDGSLSIGMQNAVIANEFSRLGEVTIMTKPPLRLLLEAAPDQPRGLEGDVANFIIGAVRIFAAGQELVDPKDRKLAEVLAFYGSWPMEGPRAVMGEDGIAGVEYVAKPEEPSDQGFDGIGWASSIFSRFYADQTVDGDRIVQLLGEAAPEWFAPLSDWDFANSRLSLWLGRIEPNLALLATMQAQAASPNPKKPVGLGCRLGRRKR